MGEIRPLTGFRFLAALYVFLFHVDMPFRAPMTWLPQPLQNVIHEGRLGVTAFFVLSGFVLVYSHLREFTGRDTKPLSYWGGFMYRRLSRIYPVFIAGLLALLPFSLLLHALPQPYIVLLSATFLQTYFPPIAMKWYDGGAWSVANEIFFYLLFPLALPWLLRLHKPQHLMRVIAACALFCTVMGVWAWVQPSLWSWQLSFSFPPFRFPEFLAGMAIGVLVLRFKWSVAPAVAVATLLFAGLYLMILGPHLGGTTVIHDWLVVPCLALLFSAMTFSPDHVAFRWLGSNFMRYLGHISYAFYIAQIPLSAVLDWLIGSHRVSQTNPLILPVGFAVNLLAAAALHALIEKPAHRWLSARKKRQAATVAIPA